jgi:hypothetical protein
VKTALATLPPHPERLTKAKATQLADMAKLRSIVLRGKLYRPPVWHCRKCGAWHVGGKP